MTRLRMVADAIAALLSAATRTKTQQRATNRRNHLLLAEKYIAAEQHHTNGDKP